MRSEMKEKRETHQILNPHVCPMFVQLDPNHRYPRLLLLLLERLLLLHLNVLDLRRRSVLRLLRRLSRGDLGLNGGFLCCRYLINGHGRRRRRRGEVLRPNELDVTKVRVEEGDQAVEAGREEVRVCVFRFFCRLGLEKQRIGGRRGRGRRWLGVGVRVLVVVRSIGSRFCGRKRLSVAVARREKRKKPHS